MIRKGAQRASLFVLLQLVIVHSSFIYALSISSTNTKNTLSSGITGRNGNHQQNVIHSSLLSNSGASNLHQMQQLQQQQQQQQQQQMTTISPLMMTTNPQNSYLDSLAQIQQSKQLQQQQQQDDLHAAGEHRSAGGDHDDSVPLATINNHSRNNQPVARPPQYVDVSALVGRNSSSSSPTVSGSSLSSNGASGLSAKSRSGLPECATQQVCNAIFVRMNYTQKLCECGSNYNWKCSNTLDPQDGHTIELTRKFDKRIYTQIKTCEPLREVRACKSPTDWTLLALQSERSGKAHYVVVCKCPTWAQLEGPYTHNHPPYANIPGIRVYGMLCAHQTARSSAQTYATYNPALSIYPEFPWSDALNVLNTTNLISTTS